MKFFNHTHFDFLDADEGLFWVQLNLFAKEEFKTLQFVQFPQVGSLIEKEEILLAIESTKAIFELESPVKLKVIEIDYNEQNPLDLRLKIEPLV